MRGQAWRDRSRALWPGLALPGIGWLVAFVLVPLFAVLAVAFGRLDPVFGNADPVWNPLDWNTTVFQDVLDRVLGAELREVYLRTFAYVGAALAISFVVGYPVAYYVARFGGRRRGLLLGLVLAPFWINYLMRMLAWINLLQEDGYVNDVLSALHLTSERVNWLEGRASTVVLGLAYGYLPFLILPLFAALDRIDRSLIEASRDLGMGPLRTFLRVTLPLSKQGILAAGVITALPMMGDYYTSDLLSGSPRTSMIGNQIEFYLFEGSQKNAGASLVLILSVLLVAAMAYYLVQTDRATRQLHR